MLVPFFGKELREQHTKRRQQTCNQSSLRPDVERHAQEMKRANKKRNHAYDHGGDVENEQDDLDHDDRLAPPTPLLQFIAIAGEAGALMVRAASRLK